METSAEIYQRLVRKYAEMPGVSIGKMMSVPGLKVRNKVFAFFHDKKGFMGFRLGPAFDPEKFGVIGARPLSPFKTKPPLKGWFLIDPEYSGQWEALTEIAYQFTQTLKK